MEELIKSFRESLESLDRIRAEALFQQALTTLLPIEAVEQLVIPALEQIGTCWHEGSVALSQVYMSGRFCEELIDRVLPPSDPDRKLQPRSAIVVLSDYHMLGKRIVYSVLRASGFELLVYGRMEAGDLVRRVMNDHIEIVLISTLMLPSALRVKDVRAMLKASGYDAKIVVGGAPFRLDDQLWQEVGADAVGRNASEAVGIVNQLAGDLR